MSKYISTFILFISLSITAFAADIKVEVTHSSCASNGEIKIIATNTVGQVQYSVERINSLDPMDDYKYPLQSSNVFYNLKPNKRPSVTGTDGEFVVKVYDATSGSNPAAEQSGIIITSNYIAPTMNIPTTSTSSANKYCADNGTLTASCQNGTAPYTFTIKNNNPGGLSYTQTSNNRSYQFTGLPAGNYTVEIKDNCGSEVRYTKDIYVTSYGDPLKSVTFDTFEFVPYTITGTCQNVNIGGYYNTSFKINGSTSLARSYYDKIMYRMEYPVGSGKTTSWTTSYYSSSFNNLIKDYDPSAPTTYRMEVLHPCTGVITKSQILTLPKVTTTFTCSVSGLVYPDYCTIPTQGVLSLTISSSGSGFNSYVCDNNYRIEAIPTDGSPKFTANWTKNSTSALIYVAPGKKYKVRIIDSVTNQLVHEYPTEYQMTATNGYMNLAAKAVYQYEQGYEYGSCDFTKGAIGLYLGSSSSVVRPTAAYSYSRYHNITFSMIEAPAGVPLRSDVKLSNTGLLWDKLPHGTYKVRANYGCTPERTQDFTIVLQPYVTGFKVTQAPKVVDGGTCEYVNITAQGHFHNAQGAVVTSSTPGLTTNYYYYMISVFDVDNPSVIHKTGAYSSNGIITLSDLTRSRTKDITYRVRFHSYYPYAPNYTDPSKACYYAEYDVIAEKYEEPEVKAHLSGGITCAEAGNKANLTVVATGSSRPFRYCYKVKGAGDETFSAWQSEENNAEANIFKNLAPGHYTVKVWNACGSVVRQDLTIFNSGDQFVDLEGWVEDEKEGAVCEGKPVRLKVLSIGPVKSYRWQKSPTGNPGTFVDIPGETGPFYDILSVDNSHIGVYKVIVKTDWCDVESQIKIVKIVPPAETPSLTATECIISGTSTTLTAHTNVTSPSYQWFRNGSQIKGASSKTYAAKDPGLYQVAVTPPKACQSDLSNTVLISLPELYWRKDAEATHNWNDTINWLDKNQKVVGTLPCGETSVYIPAKADKYPSLDINNTPIATYGMPTCGNITFEYGGEIAYPHRLVYNKAFVQYNWGTYGTFTDAKSGKQPDSPATVNTKKRDQWYTLAAPLKKMASGDFSFAGYPMSWQARFNMPHPVTGEIQVGDFSKSYEANNIDLSETYNAIVVKVGIYDKNKIGLSNHKNLEGLGGYLEIPYFENAKRTPYHTAHSYDKLRQQSNFYYFNTNTLQILPNPIGTMKRGADAYRFVYEKDNNETPTIDAGALSGVKGYTMKVKVADGASQKVLIGNPFMSSINSLRFLNANSANIKNNSDYELYSNATQQWNAYPYTNVNHIGPLQAFVITLADNKKDVDLYFPLEGTYALTGAGQKGSLQRMPSGISLFVKAKDASETESNYAVLELTNTNESESNIQKMIYPEGHATPEIFFVEPELKEYNLVQYASRGIQELPLGIKSSQKGQELTLVFENVNEFTYANGVRPVLVDKELGKEVDLLKVSSYKFTQRATSPEQQYSDTDRLLLRLEPHSDLITIEGIKITYSNQTLSVESEKTLESVSVYDLYGRLVHNRMKLQENNYNENLSLPSGVYVVKAKTIDGDTKVEKIAAL